MALLKKNFGTVEKNLGKEEYVGFFSVFSALQAESSAFRKY